MGKGEEALTSSDAEPESAVEVAGAGERATIRVRVESPAVEAVTCPVRFDRAVSPGGTSLFEMPEEARAWPAVCALLEIQGVHSIIGKGDALVIARHESAEWPEVLGAIEAALKEAFAEDGTVEVQLPAHVAATSPSKAPGSAPATAPESADSQDSLRGRVSDVIEEQINPALASHGGYIDLLDVQGSRVFVRMGGGCQGCAMSSATLKQGVETTLRAEIPEITEILDTTDHASGANPFYGA